MKIVKKKDTNVVVLIADNLSMDSGGTKGTGWKARHMTPDEYILETVPNVPDDFVNGGYTYSSGVWVLTDFGIRINNRRNLIQARLENQENLSHNVEKDAILNRARGKTPAQIDQWIENTVTDLGSAKQILKFMIKYILKNIKG